jgi:LacI family transcriptional regulator
MSDAPEPPGATDQGSRRETTLHGRVVSRPERGAPGSEGPIGHRQRRPTQADVARLAGVSQALVSYVLNGTVVSVTPATRRKILHAIESLGYIPHGAARSLRTRQTMTIALVVPDITNPFWPEVQRGVQEVADNANYQVMTFNTENEPGRLNSVCLSILGAGADGAIICDLHESASDVHRLVSSGIPLTYNGGGHGVDRSDDRVGIDNVGAAREVGLRLAGRDFDRIAIIAGSPDTTNGAERLRGFLDGLHDGGRSPATAEVAYGDFTFESGQRAMDELISSRGRPPDAVFAANDLMALGAMQSLRGAGFDIPEDTALVGFDDIAVARMVTPSLTTVDQPKRALGRRAAELLISRMSMDIDAPARIEVLPCLLVLRASA